MKKKLIAMLLALTTISQAMQFGFATGISGDPAPQTEEAPAPQAEDTSPEEEVSPGLEWCSYKDFLMNESEDVWDNPEVFIGTTARFNFEYNLEFPITGDTALLDDSYLDNVEDYLFATPDDLKDDNGESIRVVITDYTVNKIADDEGNYTTGDFWFKVEAAEGYSLPAILEANPYVLFATYKGEMPTLIFDPLMGVFVGDTVFIQNQAVMASKTEEHSTADLPATFPVEYILSTDNNSFYELLDAENWDGVSDGYKYVPASSVILVPTIVSRVYDALISADGTVMYDAIMNNVPKEITAKFTDAQKAELDAVYAEFVRRESIEYHSTVSYEGKSIEVAVKGKIPETGITLSVAPVTATSLSDEGFKFEEGEKIITALDIKLYNTDGTEWQPEERYPVEVSIGMTPLGIGEGRVLTLRHKHEDKISKNDVFVVMDGKLTAVTGGFSIYVVTEVKSTTAVNPSESYNNGDTINLVVGDEKVFYFNTNNDNGTWRVTDTDGAIHYTVHANVADSADIGHNQVKARWIKIVALKETTTPITLEYNTGRNNPETYSLNITPPKADANGKRLYIKDIVNTTGCIEAALTDSEGNDISDQLAGAAYSWTRDDELFIVPQAYEDGYNYKRVNIAVDHGGLVEARKNDDETAYKPTTYTLRVILADGTELEDSYTVYYQSEIINSGFEFPDSAYRDFSFFPNGYPELYWKTTAPGTGTGNITKDIEYGDVTGDTEAADYTVDYAADHKTGGTQFAELNAEAFGALYQDIITAPGEDIKWDFAHAARYPSWATTGGYWGGGTNDTSNKMYIVIGPTEAAQKLTTQDDLEALLKDVKTLGGDSFLNGEISVDVTYEGATYTVWYHNADDDDGDNDSGWFKLNGSYNVPDGQYRTRLFFVSDPGNSTHPNAGNLIDIAKAGQYKEYLIEYYEEKFDENGQPYYVRYDDDEETGKALIYSTVALQNFSSYINEKKLYLHEVKINGANYPYDVRYKGEDTATLYIEPYEGQATDLLNGGKTYSEKDAVMQLIFRETVVAVEKQLIFPTTLTEEHKLTLMKNMETSSDGGYKADFLLTSGDEGYTYSVNGSAVITKRDPAGNYKAFVSVGDAPDAEHNYYVQETGTTEIPGLVLSQVDMSVQLFNGGTPSDIKIDPQHYTADDIAAGKKLNTSSFALAGSTKIADVSVINTYLEKETKITYHAIGNGKIKLNDAINFEDAPSETLPFYSGKSIGCSVHEGNGATFMGWYKDEACTQKVTAADGVVDEVTGAFKPNANILNEDEVHFYAKFETFKIVINRTGAEPGKTFVYKVVGPYADPNDTRNVVTYVTVTCDENGTGSTVISEAAMGTYHVYELDEWSWRYDGADAYGSHSETETSITVGFGSSPSEQWLDGYSTPVKNVYGG